MPQLGGDFHTVARGAREGVCVIPIIVVVSIPLLLPLPMPASVHSAIVASANTTVKGPPSGPFGLWESAMQRENRRKPYRMEEDGPL